MAITIESGVLSRAMKTAATIVEGANTIPILANVRLEARGDELEITTTNMEIEFRQRVSLAQGGELSTTVDARRLAAIAGAAESGQQISLDLADGRLVAKAGRSRWQLPVISAADFPPMPFEAAGHGLRMTGKELGDIVDRTLWSASTEETRYYLCGIYVDPEGSKVRFTTTNGISIVCLTSDLAWPGDAPPVIIPSKFARTMKTVVSEAADVAVAWNDGKIRVTVGDVTLTGKLVEGTFPDYRRVLPQKSGDPILVDPENLRRALKRMELVGSEKTRAVAVDIRDGWLEVQMADGGGAGEANEQVPADCRTLHRAGFNCRYLAEALAAVGGDTVQIHQEAPNALALIERAVPDGTICGVMPMRV